MVEETRQYTVRGRVQGVGFRWWTRRIAGELAVVGTVRNCPDGSVEVVAKGNVAALDRLERELSRGPAAARVDSVERLPADGEVSGVDFEIVVERGGP